MEIIRNCPACGARCLKPAEVAAVNGRCPACHAPVEPNRMASVIFSGLLTILIVVFVERGQSTVALSVIAFMACRAMYLDLFDACFLPLKTGA